jgi:hypothetical protein
MKEFYVYILLDPRKPGSSQALETQLEYEPFYVGLGKNDRMNNHGRNAPNPILARKIAKIEDAGLTVIRIKLLTDLSREEAGEIEIRLIKQYGKISDRTGILANIADGGLGGDVIHSHPDRAEIYRKREVTRKKLKIGWHSPENGLRVSKAKKGVPLSEAHRKALSEKHADVSGEKNPMFGKNHSPETIAKLKQRKQEFLADPVKKADFFRRVGEGKRGKSYEQLYGAKAEEMRKKRSDALKAHNADPEVRRKKSEAKKAYWAKRRELSSLSKEN